MCKPTIKFSTNGRVTWKQSSAVLVNIENKDYKEEYWNTEKQKQKNKINVPTIFKKFLVDGLKGLSGNSSDVLFKKKGMTDSQS